MQSPDEITLLCMGRSIASTVIEFIYSLLVPEGYSPISAFTDEFAQLSGYRTSPRPLQDSLVTWLDKTPGVKFSGIYIKAEDSRPFLNGHAYVSDPFIRFKPPHPAEINQLAVEAERGTRCVDDVYISVS